MYMYTYVMYIYIVLNPNLRFHNRIYKNKTKKNLAPSLER